MGLDMSLYKIKKGEKYNYQNAEEIIYWRKANMIHKWFVDNVQDGEDFGEAHKVSKEQIEELRNLCREVLLKSKLKSKRIVVNETNENGKWVPTFIDGKVISNPEVAEELLPTQSGFFFGRTDYDEYYLENIKFTYRELSELLHEFDFENYDIYYQSNW